MHELGDQVLQRGALKIKGTFLEMLRFFIMHPRRWPMMLLKTTASVINGRDCQSTRPWARYLLGLLCIACLLNVSRTSAGEPQPGIFGNDDRRVIDQQSAPWSAIGQVNATGYRRAKRCTGSLIANNLVITAAHCVMDPWRRKPFPLHQIHFLAGVKGSGWLGHSTAKCLHFPPGYEYVGPSKLLPNLPFQDVPRRALFQDTALIVLKDDLDNSTPLQVARSKPKSSKLSLVHASYPSDRRYILSGHFGCQLLAQDKDLWFTDCDTHAASSGGPVFIQKQDGLKLAAIMVGVAKQSYSIAVPITDWIDVAAQRKCP